MSLDLTGGRRSTSPTNSGRPTTVPRDSRRTVEEGIYKTDKGLRRYGTTIERALASWEISPQEWADYIAFLGRLLKAIQGHPPNAPLLPHSSEVASKLAQCLNPALPSGVHQKALEVYAYIFSTFGQGYLAGHLHEFLPGLAAVLSFASLSVRPGLYSIFEDYVVHLPAPDLRPVLKSLILSLLPALEEETSEDYDRAFRILETLEQAFSPATSDNTYSDKDGYFWQCVFLSAITTPSRRQGALNFLTAKLPKFTSIDQIPQHSDGTTSGRSSKTLSPAVEVVVSPEPGLLIRCFACGLSDPQVLIQRGFLDLLVTHIPLDSHLLQSRVREEDLDRLISAAIQVLLRREMSLNRRLWSWFLGPDPKATATDSRPSSPTAGKKQYTDSKADWQFKYFAAYGRKPLERCILAMFERNTTHATERARPFRICLSLMDRWEIGGSLVPQMFLPALESAYRYSQHASPNDTADVVRSASLFFDGIEATLIWSKLVQMLEDGCSKDDNQDKLLLFAWIVQHFNIKDEEMLTVHIPYAAIYLMSLLLDSESLYVSGDGGNSSLDITFTLLDMIPDRAFAQSAETQSGDGQSSSQALQTKTIRNRLDAFYRTRDQSSSSELPIGSDEMARTLYYLAKSLASKALAQESDGSFSRVVSFLLILHPKVPSLTHSEHGDLLLALSQKLDTESSKEETLLFPDLTSIISLMAVCGSNQSRQQVIVKSDIVKLGSMLTQQLWRYLSPSLPKYNVEAARSLWQLQDHIFPDDCLESSLTSLVRHAAKDQTPSEDDRVEAIRRFIVLWSHTIPAPPGAKAGTPGTSRKSSLMPNVPDTKQSSPRLRTLAQPMMLVLDLLSEPTDTICDVVRGWLGGLPTLEKILGLHFELINKHPGSLKKAEGHDRTSTRRLNAEGVREVEYIIQHFLNILRNGNEWVWQCLNDTSSTIGDGVEATSGVVFLANWCTGLICDSGLASSKLERKSIELLDTLLSGPSTASLKFLELDSRLMDHLMKCLSANRNESQGAFLKLITKALRLRLMAEPLEPSPDGRTRASLSLKRPSVAETNRPSPSSSSTTLSSLPPPQLFSCLKTGFSSAEARVHLDQWLTFLSNVLPLFADAIFASLIPLVECLCGELDKTYVDLVSMAKIGGGSNTLAPEATTMFLLEALEMILARAHDSLVDDRNAEPALKPPVQSRGLFGSVTSGVFKAEGAPTKSTQANSRLTVVLALQDAIRVSSKLWLWANQYSDNERFDKMSAATASYNALKVRNRTRHLLEHSFAMEPLESLEVIIYYWCYSEDSTEASAAVDLLHVIQGLRPKNIVPATLDALCSRVNPAALPLFRQSSQTIDLTSLDVAMFFSAYLRSIEDDAMDEVWSDCMAFLRDVLSNPLPYRQVLPALLSTVLLLAEKVDNTNFGEQRKMRRDLGDVFLRLLAATFTTLPSGHIIESSTLETQPSTGDSSNSAQGRRAMNLIVVLKNVTANIEVILETYDRTVNAINSISNNVIAPVLRAKSFPGNMTSDTLALLLQISKKAPSAKPWKKELLDAFNDARLLLSSAKQMEANWFPVFYQWCLHDKERMPELLSRLAAPSSAGIMFGVGANAARLEADRKTQLNLRRISLLLLASPPDTFIPHYRVIEEKLVELFDANASSSPSIAVKAELFMLCHTLVLSSSTVHLAPFWPIINDNLQAALTSLLPNAVNSNAFGNLSLLQACKLLDVLVVVSPDEFQLHEWLYISDTIDAVYQPPDWKPSALSDQVAEALTIDGAEDNSGMIPPIPVPSNASGRRRPLLNNDSTADKEDIKAMPRDDFAGAILRPFLSQLSLHAYEGVYSMDTPDLSACRRALLEDLLDLGSIVE